MSHEEEPPKWMKAFHKVMDGQDPEVDKVVDSEKAHSRLQAVEIAIAKLDAVEQQKADEERRRLGDQSPMGRLVASVLNDARALAARWPVPWPTTLFCAVLVCCIAGFLLVNEQLTCLACEGGVGGMVGEGDHEVAAVRGAGAFTQMLTSMDARVKALRGDDTPDVVAALQAQLEQMSARLASEGFLEPEARPQHEQRRHEQQLNHALDDIVHQVTSLQAEIDRNMTAEIVNATQQDEELTRMEEAVVQTEMHILELKADPMATAWWKRPIKKGRKKGQLRPVTGADRALDAALKRQAKQLAARDVLREEVFKRRNKVLEEAELMESEATFRKQPSQEVLEPNQSFQSQAASRGFSFVNPLQLAASLEVERLQALDRATVGTNCTVPIGLDWHASQEFVANCTNSTTLITGVRFEAANDFKG